MVGQTGDAVKALHCFSRAARLDPSHPLPFVNAARTYTQLSQPTQAAEHLARAIELDPALATIRYDYDTFSYITSLLDHRWIAPTSLHPKYFN